MKYSAIALLALGVAAATPADAQIRFKGNTMGCFGFDCTPVQYTGLDHLNFTGESFDGYTGEGGNLFLSLGYFSWDSFYGSELVETPFTLFLNFVYPTGIDPDPVYYGDMEGLVIRGKVNGVRVGESDLELLFEPAQRSYTFTGGRPNGSGVFTLTLYDTYIKPFSDSRLTAKISDAEITGTVTPEPMSMILLGTGLAGVAAARRRRKQQQV